MPTDMATSRRARRKVSYNEKYTHIYTAQVQTPESLHLRFFFTISIKRLIHSYFMVYKRVNIDNYSTFVYYLSLIILFLPFV